MGRVTSLQERRRELVEIKDCVSGEGGNMHKLIGWK